MKYQIIALTCIFLASCGSTEIKKESEVMQKAKSDSSSLNGEQIKGLIVGKTMFGVSDGNNFTTQVNTDGTVAGTFGDASDTGTYTIEGNKYCRVWKKWGKSEPACWTMHKIGNGYTAKTATGSSNPYNFSVR